MLKELKVNETPVRTSRNFNINNAKLKGINIPETIGNFENVNIIGKVAYNVSSSNITYGLGNELIKQVQENANQNLKVVVEENINQNVEIDFNFDKTSRIGSVKLVAKKKSFLYKGSITISFKINDYISTTIDLQNSPITIKANDNQWYSQIIAYLKSLPNWQFDNDIYNHLHIKGGANDDNAIWLWDEQKGVLRNAEFFLLKNDKIMNQNSSVEFDLLNQNKVWVDKLEDRYSKGEHEIYFAIKKGLNDLNLEWDIDSTFSQIGLESWKDVDILVYKVKVKII